MNADTHALLLRLALTTTTCPCTECHGNPVVDTYFCQGEQLCCNGTSRVPLILGLREVEPVQGNSHLECVQDSAWAKRFGGCLFRLPHLNAGNTTVRYMNDCQGRGWTVTTNSETIAQSLWPLLERVGQEVHTGEERVWDFIDDYVEARASGHDAEAWQAAACALEEAGLLEKERP